MVANFRLMFWVIWTTIFLFLNTPVQAGCFSNTVDFDPDQGYSWNTSWEPGKSAMSGHVNGVKPQLNTPQLNKNNQVSSRLNVRNRFNWTGRAKISLDKLSSSICQGYGLPPNEIRYASHLREFHGVNIMD